MDNSHKHRRPTEFIQMINYDEDTNTLLQREKNKSILYCSSISNLQVSVANVQYLVTRTLA